MRHLLFLTISLLSGLSIFGQDSFLVHFMGSRVVKIGSPIDPSEIDTSLTSEHFKELNRLYAPFYVTFRLLQKDTVVTPYKEVYANIDSIGNVCAIVIPTRNIESEQAYMVEAFGAATNTTGMSSLGILIQNWAVNGYCVLLSKSSYENYIVIYNCLKKSFFHYPDIKKD